VVVEIWVNEKKALSMVFWGDPLGRELTLHLFNLISTKAYRQLRDGDSLTV
jgi:hypothetical protein